MTHLDLNVFTYQASKDLPKKSLCETSSNVALNSATFSFARYLNLN